MLRLIFYGVLFFFLWKIVRSLGSLFHPSPPSPRPRNDRKAPTDLSNIQDAEFEDITNKKESGEGKQPPK